LIALISGDVYLTIILILFALILIGLIGSVAAWHSFRKEQKASKALIIKVGFLVPISFWGPIYLSMYILNEFNNDLSIAVKIVIFGIAVIATIYAALKLLVVLLKPSFDNKIDTKFSTKIYFAILGKIFLILIPISIATRTIIPLVLEQIASNDNDARTKLSFEDLKIGVEKAKAQLPAQKDQFTILADMELTEEAIVYRVNYEKGFTKDIDISKLAISQESTTLFSICTKGGSNPFFENGLSIIYNFYDESGELLVTNSFSPKSCFPYEGKTQAEQVLEYSKHQNKALPLKLDNEKILRDVSFDGKNWSYVYQFIEVSKANLNYTEAITYLTDLSLTKNCQTADTKQIINSGFVVKDFYFDRHNELIFEYSTSNSECAE